MSKILPLLVLAATVLLLSGCVGPTSQAKAFAPQPGEKAPDGRPLLARVEVDNRGVFLFDLIPIWSGYPYHTNLRRFEMFKNYVKAGYLNEMLDAERHRLKGEGFTLPEYSESSSGWYTLGIFWTRSMSARAGIIAPAKAAKKGK